MPVDVWRSVLTACTLSPGNHTRQCARRGKPITIMTLKKSSSTLTVAGELRSKYIKLVLLETLVSLSLDSKSYRQMAIDQSHFFLD